MKASLSKNLRLLLATCLLTGCVAATAPTVAPVSIEVLQQQLLELPGAVVDLQSLTVSYQGETLFASGAALPFPGGMELLDPLMSWMLQDERISGIARVRSSGEESNGYNRILASKRLELLERLFRNRGITPDRLQLLVDESAGAPLEIRFQLRSSPISAGEKE